MSGLILAPPPRSAGAAINTINEAMSHHSKTDAANIRIMAAAIIVLFSVVLFIIALHLYAKCFWKNALRSHRRPEQGLDYEIHEALEAEQSRGLEKAVIESLPTFTYSAESMPKGLECAVCLCEFEDNEKARFLPKCSHVFHTECIDMWFESHSTCPLCRLRLTIVPSKKADHPLGCSTAVPIDFSTFDINFISSHDPSQVRHANRDLCALQQDEIGPIDQHERLPLPSAAESKYLNKQQGLQEASVMAPLHLAIDLPRPSCESACGSCSGHPFSSTALCPKSPLSWFSLRRILSRDRKVAPSASTSADYDEEIFSSIIAIRLPCDFSKTSIAHIRSKYIRRMMPYCLAKVDSLMLISVNIIFCEQSCKPTRNLQLLSLLLVEHLLKRFARLVWCYMEKKPHCYLIKHMKRFWAILEQFRIWNVLRTIQS